MDLVGEINGIYPFWASAITSQEELKTKNGHGPEVSIGECSINLAIF